MTASRFTVVHAPAGFGKTTLLTQWAASAGERPLWFPASAADAEPGALATRMLGLLTSQSVPGAIIVDNFDHVAHLSFEDGLGPVILEHPLVRLVVASQTVPYTCLTHAEIPSCIAVRADDLRFRSYEVEQLFRRQAGISLDSWEIDSVLRTTDGRPAELRKLLLQVDWRALGARRAIFHDVAGRSPTLGMNAKAEREGLLAIVNQTLRPALDAVLAGKALTAFRLLRRFATSCDAEELVALVAQLILLVVGIRANTEGEDFVLEQADDIRRSADQLGFRWLATMARTVVAAVLERSSSPRRTRAIAEECDEREDRLGATLVTAVASFVKARFRCASADDFVRLADCFRELQLSSLEQWARVAAAEAGVGAGDVELHPVKRTAPAVVTPRASGIAVTCFGGFQLLFGGGPIDLTMVRPRALTVLHLLALHSGRAVHRDLLATVLWGDLDSSSALHNLHVSISSLRGALNARQPDCAAHILVRRGETYALAIDERSRCDLTGFDDALQRASASRARGDGESTGEALRRAVSLYVGEVLPEVGPAEWVLGARDRYRLRAAEAASSLAHLELRLGDSAAAAFAAARAVEIDPWRDESWRTLIDISRQAGDFIEAERAERAYAQVLVSLDIAP